MITRRTFTAALSLTGVAGFALLRLIEGAMAQSASDIRKPVSLPDMALGPADAAVTITEFAAATCPHCAAFNADVFPKIKSTYIDTGKIRYVFHEFPLDPIAAASSVLSRCIANGDSAKFFAVTDMLFKQDWSKVTKPRETLNLIGKQAGLDERQVETCLKDDTLFNGIVASRTNAAKLGVNATPTFLINGEKIVGMQPFEEFDRRFKALLKI